MSSPIGVVRLADCRILSGLIGRSTDMTGYFAVFLSPACDGVPAVGLILRCRS